MSKSFVDEKHCGPADEAGYTPKILHVYQHSTWHAAAAIVGNREALTALRDTLNGLLSEQSEFAEIGVVPGDDGEGYRLKVWRVDKPITDRFWSDLPGTYEVPSVQGFADYDCDFVTHALTKRWMCEACSGWGGPIDYRDQTFPPHRDKSQPPCAKCNGTGVRDINPRHQKAEK